MSQREIHFLRRIIPLQGRILEIGSASGVTISLLAEEFPDVRFLSVDHYPSDRFVGHQSPCLRQRCNVLPELDKKQPAE